MAMNFGIQTKVAKKMHHVQFVMKFLSVPLLLSVLSALLLVTARPYESQVYYIVDLSDDVVPFLPDNTISKRAVKREKIVMDSLGGDYLVRKRNYL
ncbi:unnamed protein product [Bursaphelenchus xylophilus]|uniref:(pine wood nematode) hypothetical protein n=1 Tax=Bursaphelenchus xylophilus TaxID=6326 RepID=A0A1I7SWP7_BURXY|nr:unnamed protein product [Bursaphelenchus xylophilus]CAG9099773.1 unnamed protein product [Bursaphelenchus xylophilus]